MLKTVTLSFCVLLASGLAISLHLSHIQSEQIKRAKYLQGVGTLYTFGGDFDLDSPPWLNLCENVSWLADKRFDEFLENYVGAVTPGGITRAEFDRSNLARLTRRSRWQTH